MAFDVPDPDQEARRKAGARADDGVSHGGGTEAADNWLADLLHDHAAKEPAEPSAQPTEPVAAPGAFDARSASPPGRPRAIPRVSAAIR